MKCGAWHINPSINKSTPEISKEHMDIFNNAIQGMAGGKYEMLIHAGQQMVSGMNHLYIAQHTLVTQGDEEKTLVKMVIYVPFEGEPVITLTEQI